MFCKLLLLKFKCYCVKGKTYRRRTVDISFNHNKRWVYIFTHLKRCQHRVQTGDEILNKWIVDFVKGKFFLRKK